MYKLSLNAASKTILQSVSASADDTLRGCHGDTGINLFGQ